MPTNERTRKQCNAYWKRYSQEEAVTAYRFPIAQVGITIEKNGHIKINENLGIDTSTL
jgi:hypothetical protein